MKRLQLKRYINEETPIFESREKALEYFSLMVSETDNRHMVGGGLYGEPVVAKYYDIDGVVQLILGIGVENGYGVGYHIIDTAKLIIPLKTLMMLNNQSMIILQQSKWSNLQVQI